MKKGATLYDISYFVGIQTIRAMHRIIRFFTLLFLPIRLLIWRGARAVSRRRDPRVREGLAGLWRRFAEAGCRVARAWKRHPAAGIAQILYLPIAAAKHYKGFTRAVATVAAIACSLTLLFGTFQYWNQTTFALALSDGDDVWGYIAEEAVLQEGVALANERLGAAASNQRLPTVSSMSLQMTRQADVWDKQQVCDYLLSETTVETREACGVYIDGVFCGALSNRRNAQRVLDEILEESREGKKDVTSLFVETVELVDGVYPTERVLPTQTVKKQLTAEAVTEETYRIQAGDTWDSIAEKTGVPVVELLQNNPTLIKDFKVGETVVTRKAQPHLRVMVSGTIQYEAEVPFTVERRPDASMYEGRERVRVKGQNGKSLITATVMYLDGVEQSSMITASEVIEEPTTQVVAYGTKKRPGKGRNMAWPTPCTRFITDYFSMSSADRHRGIDLWCRDMEGEDILAADSGTVIIATDPKGTSYWSYGKYVVIDHGDGHQTLYAHCSELLVKEGDTVKKGQRIALVGNTGRSTAPHLHFEVIVNGRNVNPLDYY